MTEKPTDLENIYSEPRTDKERPPRKQFTEKEKREPREFGEKREFKDFGEKREFKDFGEKREFKDFGEKREYREPREPREYREPREHREPREPKEYREKKEEEKKYDSDGFEIVTTVKTKPEDFKPKRKFFNKEFNKDRDFNKKGGDFKKGPYKKPYTKNETATDDKTEEKQHSGDEQTTPVQEAPKEIVKKADKGTIKIDPNAKKLRDLFA
jgi:hypothetical protein